MTALGAQAPRIVLLHEGRAGDDRQLGNLAEALGRPYEAVPFRVSIGRVVLDRVRDALGIGGPVPGGHAWGPPWPDLVLATGGRAVSAAVRLRRLSGGRTRIVFLGRPWAPLGLFDLVITTPQYRLPAAANVVQNLLPLNAIPAERLAREAERVAPSVAELPRPHIAVLLGGTSGSYRLTPDAARDIARRASARAHALGGSLLVTSSPRTPAAALDAFAAALDAPARVYRWKPDDPDNPLAGYVGLAERLIVTGESASMLAEACRTGKAVEVVRLPRRRRTRLLTAPFGGRAAPLVRRLAPLGRWLAYHGVVTPPRDLERLHAALYRHAQPADAEGTAVRLTDDGDRQRAVAAVEALLAAQGETAYIATERRGGATARRARRQQQSG